MVFGIPTPCKYLEILIIHYIITCVGWSTTLDSWIVNSIAICIIFVSVDLPSKLCLHHFKTGTLGMEYMWSINPMIATWDVMINGNHLCSCSFMDCDTPWIPKLQVAFLCTYPQAFESQFLQLCCKSTLLLY